MLTIFRELNSRGLSVSSQKEKENRFLVFTSPIKRGIRNFSSQSSSDSIETLNTKKALIAGAKLLFCLSKPVTFLPFSLSSLSSLSSLLKLLSNAAPSC